MNAKKAMKEYKNQVQKQRLKAENEIDANYDKLVRSGVIDPAVTTREAYKAKCKVEIQTVAFEPNSNPAAHSGGTAFRYADPNQTPKITYPSPAALAAAAAPANTPPAANVPPLDPTSPIAKKLMTDFGLTAGMVQQFWSYFNTTTTPSGQPLKSMFSDFMTFMTLSPDQIGKSGIPADKTIFDGATPASVSAYTANLRDMLAAGNLVLPQLPAPTSSGTPAAGSDAAIQKAMTLLNTATEKQQDWNAAQQIFTNAHVAHPPSLADLNTWAQQFGFDLKTTAALYLYFEKAALPNGLSIRDAFPNLSFAEFLTLTPAKIESLSGSDENKKLLKDGITEGSVVLPQFEAKQANQQIDNSQKLAEFFQKLPQAGSLTSAARGGRIQAHYNEWLNVISQNPAMAKLLREGKVGKGLPTDRLRQIQGEAEREDSWEKIDGGEPFRLLAGAYHNDPRLQNDPALRNLPEQISADLETIVLNTMKLRQMNYDPATALAKLNEQGRPEEPSARANWDKAKAIAEELVAATARTKENIAKTKSINPIAGLLLQKYARSVLYSWVERMTGGCYTFDTDKGNHRQFWADVAPGDPNTRNILGNSAVPLDGNNQDPRIDVRLGNDRQGRPWFVSRQAAADAAKDIANNLIGGPGSQTEGTLGLGKNNILAQENEVVRYMRAHQDGTGASENFEAVPGVERDVSAGLAGAIANQEARAESANAQRTQAQQPVSDPTLQGRFPGGDGVPSITAEMTNMSLKEMGLHIDSIDNNISSMDDLKAQLTTKMQLMMEKRTNYMSALSNLMASNSKVLNTILGNIH